MSQGRRSSGHRHVMVVTLAILFIQSTNVEAATYTVGDSSGWSFNVVNWPKGKSFNAGDMLVFKYDPTRHNVVVVNKKGYDSCTTPVGSKLYKSGEDQIKLVKGDNYFICSFPGHCGSGVKIAVTTA